MKNIVEEMVNIAKKNFHDPMPGSVAWLVEKLTPRKWYRDIDGNPIPEWVVSTKQNRLGALCIQIGPMHWMGVDIHNTLATLDPVQGWLRTCDDGDYTQDIHGVVLTDEANQVLSMFTDQLIQLVDAERSTSYDGKLIVEVKQGE